MTGIFIDPVKHRAVSRFVFCCTHGQIGGIDDLLRLLAEDTIGQVVALRAFRDGQDTYVAVVPEEKK